MLLVVWSFVFLSTLAEFRRLWRLTDSASLLTDIPKNFSVSLITGGHSGFFFIDSSRNVLARGSNLAGQLGLGDNSDRVTPSSVVSLNPIPVGMVCSGASFSAALSFGGDLFLSWGENLDGELASGEAPEFSRNYPAPVELHDPHHRTLFTSICCGARHGLLLTTDGTVLAWGQNAQTQLGDASPESRFVPIETDLESLGVSGPVHSIHCGSYHSCVTWNANSTSGLHARCFGSNSLGQLGRGDTVSPSFGPVWTDLGGLWTVFDRTYFFNVTSGEFFGTGDNSDGSLGVSSGLPSVNQPTLVTGLPENARVVSMSGSESRTVAILDNCSAADSSAYLAVSGTSDSFHALDLGVTGESGATACISRSGTVGDETILLEGVACGGISDRSAETCSGTGGVCFQEDECACPEGYDEKADSLCGTEEAQSQQQVFGCGNNEFGELGLGTKDAVFEPTVAEGSLLGLDVVQVSCGQAFSVALTETTDGDNQQQQQQVLVSGDCRDYQGGDGSTFSRVMFRSTPLPDANFTKVCAGELTVALLSDDGDIWTWGHGKYGFCGRGSHFVMPSPTRVEIEKFFWSGEKVRDFACGLHHIVAATTEHRVFSWGRNRKNQLGLSQHPFVDQFYPRLVEYSNSTGDGVHVVSVGYEHSCVLTKHSRRLLCWGDNSFGQLGHNSSSALSYSSPQRVSLEGDISNVVATGHSTFVVVERESTQVVLGAGRSLEGQLGVEGVVGSFTPLSVPENFYTASVSDSHALLLDYGGEIYSSGIVSSDGLCRSWNGSSFSKIRVSNADVPIASICAGNRFSVFSSSVKCFGIVASDRACSAHGRCVGTNRCSCESGYVSRDCSDSVCFGIASSSPSVCSSHGRCISPNRCICSELFSGQECDEDSDRTARDEAIVVFASIFGILGLVCFLLGVIWFVYECGFRRNRERGDVELKDQELETYDELSGSEGEIEIDVADEV